jgi:hypothetical protein
VLLIAIAVFLAAVDGFFVAAFSVILFPQSVAGDRPAQPLRPRNPEKIRPVSAAPLDGFFMPMICPAISQLNCRAHRTLRLFGIERVHMFTTIPENFDLPPE